MEIQMTPEVIERFKDFLVNPLKWKCSYKPLHECFVEGDHYEPQDKLFEAYLNYIKKPLPKVIFYIIMQEEFAQFGGCDTFTDENGVERNRDFGYKLKLNI